MTTHLVLQEAREGLPIPPTGSPARADRAGGEPPTSFFSRLHSDITLSPCSWKVMMIKATKMLTKKKGKTTK